MPVPSTLYRALRVANTVVFAVALALLMDHSAAAARGPLDQTPHWRSGDRNLVVVDKTGEPAWQQATRHAVEVWREALAGTGVDLSWREGSGDCMADGPRINFCQTPHSRLGDTHNQGREGLANVALAGGHSRGAIIAVCQDCALDGRRRHVVAAHEIGHALGLTHSARVTSVMYPTGSGAGPDQLDIRQLREIYDHEDTPRRCALLNLRVAGFCV